MKLIIGLGNPGEQYQDTRHNIGFMVVDHLSRELGQQTLSWKEERSRRAWLAQAGEVLLVKPTTYMNNSGSAVAALAQYYKVPLPDIWVIHDDIDLPLGKIRIRQGGSGGGHNGIDSIIKSVGGDGFLRFRLGIGRGKEDQHKSTDHALRHRSVITFVLSHFTDHEAGEMRKLIHHATDAVQIALTEGVDRAMNRFN